MNFYILIGLILAIYFISKFLWGFYIFSKKESLTGAYKIPIKIDGYNSEMICKTSYKGQFHMWDIDYLGEINQSEDIWEELTDQQKICVNLQINFFFDDLR